MTYLTRPAQQGAPPAGDLEVAQVMLQEFDSCPNPTNWSKPLNLHQINPLTWS